MIQRDPVKRMTSEDVKNKIGDLLSNRSSSTIKPLTQIGQIGLCNQSEAAAVSHKKLTVDCGKTGAKSLRKRYLNPEFEAARCDGESVSTSYTGILPIGQQSVKKWSTFAPPAKQPRYDLRDLTSAGISNNRRNPDALSLVESQVRIWGKTPNSFLTSVSICCNDKQQFANQPK